MCFMKKHSAEEIYQKSQKVITEPILFKLFHYAIVQQDNWYIIYYYNTETGEVQNIFIAKARTFYGAMKKLKNLVSYSYSKGVIL